MWFIRYEKSRSKRTTKNIKISNPALMIVHHIKISLRAVISMAILLSKNENDKLFPGKIREIRLKTE
jgi:hypothetical protein